MSFNLTMHELKNKSIPSIQRTSLWIEVSEKCTNINISIKTIASTSSDLIITFSVAGFSWRSSRARTAFSERSWSITALTCSQRLRHNELQTFWERDSGLSRWQKAFREWNRTEVGRITYAGLCSVCADWVESLSQWLDALLVCYSEARLEVRGQDVFIMTLWSQKQLFIHPD